MASVGCPRRTHQIMPHWKAHTVLAKPSLHVYLPILMVLLHSCCLKVEATHECNLTHADTVDMTDFTLAWPHNYVSPGSVRLLCPEGWIHRGSQCYRAMAVPQSWEAAQMTCKNYGGHLSVILSHDVNLAIADLLRDAGVFEEHDNYWIGMQRDEMTNPTDPSADWANGEATVVGIGRWSVNQPDFTSGHCVMAEAQAPQHPWALSWCNQLLPFVCQLPATVEDHHLCRDGTMVKNAYVLDGVEDCDDGTDELANSPLCGSALCVVYESGISGRISANNYGPSQKCTWIVQGPQGSHVQLKVVSFSTERYLDYVDVWTGASSIAASTHVATLSGRLDTQPTFVSNNNWMIIRMNVDGETEDSGFTAEWTTEYTCAMLELPYFCQEEGFLAPPAAMSLAQCISLCEDSTECHAVSYQGGSCTWLSAIHHRTQDPSCRFFFKPCPPSSGNNVTHVLPNGGGHVGVTSSWTTIYSPFYPLQYFTGLELAWSLEAPMLHIITIKAIEMDLSAEDSVTIYDGDGTQSPVLVEFTGKGVDYKHRFIFTTTNEAFIFMKAVSLHPGRGFQFHVIQGCQAELTGTHGLVQSPNFGIEYPLLMICTWTVQADDQQDVVMIFNENFAIDTTTTGDKLEIYSGVDDAGLLLDVYDDTNVPDNIIAPAGRLFVRFTSDAVYNTTGFSAVYSKGCPSIQLDENTLAVGLNDSLLDRNRLPRSFGATFNVTCPEGYMFSSEHYRDMPSDFQILVHCEVGGHWNIDFTPKCVLQYCGSPFDEVPNGFITQLTSPEHAGEAEFECLEGYALDNDGPSVCSANGTWDNLPTCQAQNCPSITAPMNGELSYLTQNSTRQGTIVQFICDEGYMLEGVPVIYCTVQGNWSAPTDPMCRAMECLAIPVANGNHNGTLTMAYGEVLGYRCDEGYMLTGDGHLECGLSGVWSEEPPECQDINECPESVCDQHCVNVPGSFRCQCDDGYSLDANGFSCSSVMECMDPTLHGCMDQCADTNTSYTCACDWPGVALLRDDGITDSRFAHPQGGWEDWNVLRYNESCVYTPLCPALAEPVEHGMVLSSRPSYYLNETLTILCDLGYIIDETGDPALSQFTLTCMDDGTWSSPVPTCSSVVCHSADLDLAGLLNPVVLNASETGYMETLDMTCHIDGISEPISRQRTCVYNTVTKEYELIGDALECGVIDCGHLDASMVSGLGIVVTAPDTVYSSSFEFICSGGVSSAGNSSLGNHVITCQANGQWDLGSLHCPGPVCEDPGTPGGAQQVISPSAYHVDAEVRICCSREGYEPYGGDIILCESVDNATATWNESISECVDVSPPVFECDQSTLYVDLYEILALPPPRVTDNSGRVVNITITPESLPLGAAVSANGMVHWLALDDNMNEARCSIPVTVIEHQPVIWDHPCSPQSGVLLLDDLDYIALIDVEEIANYSISSPLQYSVTFEPEMVDFNADRLDKITTVRMHVESTAPHISSEDVCVMSFTVKAAPCREFTLRTPANGEKDCRVVGEKRTCVMSCQSGFLFKDLGADFAVFTCTEGSNWSLNGTESSYVPDCVDAPNPVYSQTVELDYVDNNPVCATQLDSAIKADLDSLQLHPICTFSEDITISISDYDYTFLAEQLHLTLVIVYENAPTEVLEACSGIVSSSFLNAGIALPVLNVLDLPNCAQSPTYDSTTGISSEVACLGDYQLQIVGDDILCVPCSSGSFKSNDDCELCPTGTYQIQMGQSDCLPCPVGTSTYNQGAIEEDMCVTQCPAGWVSESSLPPCSPCPADSYWVNATMCQTCPEGTSTARVAAAPNNASCFAACAPGHYSPSGFEPCAACPVGFVQDGEGQSSCLACADGSSTAANGSISVAACRADVNQLCDSLEYCHGNGSCSIKGNYFVCDCSEGYMGWFCENRVPDPCLSSPCYNNGTCVADGLDYTCHCVQEMQYSYLDTANTAIDGPAIDSLTRVNLTDCQALCSTNEACLAFITTVNGVDPQALDCYLYASLITREQTGTTLYLKQEGMVPVFNGSHCEVDLKNACEESPCENEGMCRDDINDYTCFCSSFGGVFYTGDQCQDSTEICNAPGQECYNGASCVLMSTFRRYCHCADGYTGPKCEVEIDECQLVDYPCLYGGTCSDKINGYTCSCVEGYSGDHCENRPPNLCDPDPCGSRGKCFEDYRNDCPACVCEEGYGETYWTSWFNHGAASPDDREQRYLSQLPAPYYEHGLPLGIQCRVANLNTTWYEAGDVLRIPCVAELGLLCLGAEQEDSNCNDYEVRYMLREEYSPRCDLIDMCEGAICLNGGSCVGYRGYYTCNCAPGFQGIQCQHNVDDCLSKPCMNTGECSDQLQGFTCTCSPGYTGSLCETDINECSLAFCDPLGSSSCRDMINDYQCECQHGFRGKNCSDNIDECASNPCLNGGQCEDQVDRFVCHCEPGWTGPHCQDLDVTCTQDTCPNDKVCVNLLQDNHCSCLIDGLDGQCNITGSLCDIANPCVNCAQCVDDYDGRNVVCLCLPGYTGDGCQYRINFCGQGNLCQNGGECELEAEAGYHCRCQPGFVGTDCEVNIDDCPMAGCSTYSECVDDIGEAFCRCPQGYSGPTCEKALDRDYDLEFCGTETTRLQFPFLSNATSMSILTWVRFKEPDTEGQFLCLGGADSPDLGNPLPRDAFCMHESGMTLYVSGVAAVQVDNSIPFGFINNGGWHYLAASWDGDTEVLVAYLDNLRVETSLRAVYDQGTALPQVCQLVLGEGFRGWLSQVMVVGRALSTEELYKFNEGDYEDYEADIMQDWHGYHLGGCVQRVLDSTAGYDLHEPERTSPQITSCPSPVSTYSSSRITTLDWPAPVFSGATTVDQNYLSGSQGGAFNQGVYDIVYVGQDEEDGAAVCAFPGYVRLNNCPDPVVPEGVELNCSDISSLYRQCEVRCPSGQSFLHPMPSLVSCGPDGIWDPENPHSKFIIPHCGEIQDSMYRVEFGWQVFLQTTIVTTLQSLEALLRNLFITWADSDLARGLCLDAACSNLHIDLHVVDEETKTVAVKFVLDHFNSTIGAYDAVACHAVYQAVMLEEALLVPTVSYADVILQDSFHIEQILVCPTGAQDVAGMCVECPSGTFFNNSIGLCEDCKRGEYQDASGQLFCLSCPPGETTETGRSTSIDHCYTTCGPGYFYGNLSCEPCGYGYYQGLPGETYCSQCGLGRVTRTRNATSCEDCIDDCPGGTQLSGGEEVSCVNCSVGTYRTQEQHPICVSCPLGFTTPMPGAASMQNCSLVTCPAGQYREGPDPGVCSPCPINSYRSEDMDMAFCASCGDPTEWTTVSTRSTSEDDCLLYCAPGFYFIRSEECKPCPMNTYKPAGVAYLEADECIECPPEQSITTGLNSTSLEDCRFANCSQGQVVNPAYNASVPGPEPQCLVCPPGTYQPSPEPVDHQCLECPSGTWSVGRAEEVSECLVYCDSGYESTQFGCVPCERGFYKNNTDDRLGVCERCPVDYITAEGRPGLGVQDCAVANCSAGQYLLEVGNVCLPCPNNTYSQRPWQTRCKPCPYEWYTDMLGADSISYCKSPFKVIASFIWRLSTKYDDVEDDLNALFAKLEAYLRTEVNLIEVKFHTAVPGSTLVAGQIIYDSSLENEDSLEVVMGKYDDTASIDIKLNMGQIVCGNGTFLDLELLTCEGCSIGSYQAPEDLDLCRPCDEEYSTAAQQSFREDSCLLICPAGSQAVGNAYCEKCPLGTFKMAEGIANCTHCGLALTTEQEGTIVPRDCVANCSAGYFREDSSCSFCPEGSYADERNLYECKLCPGGQTTTFKGADGKDDCVALCALEVGYCLNGGTCYWSSHYDRVLCSCREPYLGEHCETRGEYSMIGDVIVGCSLGGGIGIIVIILLCVCVYVSSRKKPHHKEQPYMVYPMMVNPVQTVPYPQEALPLRPAHLAVPHPQYVYEHLPYAALPTAGVRYSDFFQAPGMNKRMHNTPIVEPLYH